MTNGTQPSNVINYEAAISILSEVGVFTTDDRHRDGHTSASFVGSSIDITGSSLTQREVSEKDWMQFFGHLLAVAADRGLRPAELLAIGMATVLRGTDKAT
jgi:hypothetical protein